MPLFEVLDVFPDPTPRGGPEQMALDEALLETCERPALRIYHWDGPAVSFGYSQSLAEVRRAFPALPLVRRWTGGGIVEHGCDWTFSLVVPAGEPFAALRPAESYRQIHAVVAEALGGNSHLKKESSAPPSLGGACFVQPVRDDVLAVDGSKVCGGAQRRTRKGLLHQGSVQDCEWPPDMAERLGSRMASQILTAGIGAVVMARTKELSEQKYGDPVWLHKTP